MDERRKFTRIGDSVKLKYQIIFSMGFGGDIMDGEGEAQSIDLSEGGLSFQCNYLIPKQSFLEIELSFQGKEFPIYLKGEVTRAIEVEPGKFDIGMNFEYKFEKDSQILHQYLVEHGMKS